MTAPARRVAGNISLSLDGRICGVGGDYDMGWIVPHAITAGARSHMLRMSGDATTALLGRKNYQGFSGFWPSVADNADAAPEDSAFSRWLNEVEKVVFSTTLTEAPWDGPGAIRVTSADPATVVKELRQQPGGDIVVLSSSSIIRALLAADQLDRLSVTLCPELVGGGARLFDDGTAASWTLADATPTESGALCLLYDRVRA